MKNLKLDQSYTILKLSESMGAGSVLEEQIADHIHSSPLLILDVEGILFNSMLIGEIINLCMVFEAHWKDTRHRIALVNLTHTSRAAFERMHLQGRVQLCDSLGDALAGASQLAS